MKKKRKTAYLPALSVLLVMVLMQSGCAKKVSYGSVAINSVPTSAEVINLKDDSSLGMTPVKVVWEGEEDSSEYVTVEFFKQGYKEKIISFWVNKRYSSREAAESNPQEVSVEMIKRD